MIYFVDNYFLVADNLADSFVAVVVFDFDSSDCHHLSSIERTHKIEKIVIIFIINSKPNSDTFFFFSLGWRKNGFFYLRLDFRALDFDSFAMWAFLGQAVDILVHDHHDREPFQ